MRGDAAPRAVIFDVDGTLLDSAPGIVTGFVRALTAAGVEPPSEDVLRSDLGPPVVQMLTTYGVRPDRLADGVAAYRAYYYAEGLRRSEPYPGVRELLVALSDRGVVLGTATAKRTATADAILRHHDLDGYFTVINGTSQTRTTKTETVAETVRLLQACEGGLAPVDRDRVWMVGDRRSDVEAGRRCGLRTAAVAWGYGSAAELDAAGADLIAHRISDLSDLAPIG